MAKEILSDVLVAFGGQALTDTANEASIDYSAEAQDGTTFSDDSRVNHGGLLVPAFGVSGFFQSTPDEALFADVGLVGRVVTLGAGRAVGDVAYTMQAMLGAYNPMQGAVGELARFNLNAAATGKLVRGNLMHNASRSGDGSESAVQLGQIGAAQSLYAALHVVSSSGGNLDVAIESDSADDFTGLETERLTFSTASAQGSEWLTLAGAVTDDWWRVTWTLTGTAQFIVVLGIQ